MSRNEDETSLDMNWIASLKEKVSDTKYKDKERKPTIYRVPDMLKKVDREAYEPLLVSLGPYHHDKPHLQAMNQVKWKYLKFVLEQTSGAALEKYLREIKNLETRARDAYSEEVNMRSDSFVEMMLLDGCFLMLTIMDWVNNTMTISEESTWWTLSAAGREIFMLENQLPFCILEALYKCAYPSGNPFRNLTVQFINKFFSGNLPLHSENKDIHHIVDLSLSCINPTINLGNGGGSNGGGNGDAFYRSSGDGYFAQVITVAEAMLCKPTVPDEAALKWFPNATVFVEAGVHFKRKTTATNFLDITFRKGKLEIPQLQIDGHTNSILRNLIAYEQCSMDTMFLVTSYMRFMDCLIDTAADVELLQQHEIIVSGLGDSQEVATLLNKLGMNVCFDVNNFYLAGVVENMRKYRNTRYNKWRAKLNHDYFSNPWAVISLFGVLVLFLLTVTQTIFAILSYGRSSN